MAELRAGLLIIFLAACSIWDIRFFRLPAWFLAVGIVLGTILELLGNGVGAGLFLNLLPGAGLLLISFAAPKHLGAGDGWMLMGSGALGGWERGLFLLEGGLLLLFPAAFFWGVVRKRRKQELPFAPFMLAACLCGMLFL